MVGKALGPYNILEPLGSGGMGEVYLGEDTRLGRKVAIKVLPEEFASDPERLARFEQEARAAAALNHPHIAVVHDIGYEDGGSAAEARTDPDMDLASLPAAGVHYMVQEYLEGETLREPLKKGALPVQKALDLSTEIAEALNAAHSAGIVHRDLKPENIFVTKEGHAKVLDFGLAKLLEVAPAMSPGGEASKSPTMLGTVAGQVMGTAGYMAPEQVQGDGDIDHRADLFAFGCLLYELLTGRQAFAGRNVLDTLGRIVDQDPDAMSTINPGLPAETERIVRKCLAKEPTKRYQTAGDLVVDLKALGSEVETGAALPSPGVVAPRVDAAPPAASPWRLAGPLAVAALAVGVAVGWFVTRPAPLAPEPSKIFEIDLMVRPPSHAAAISPDGETIVFVGTTPEGDENLLYVRRMNQLEYTPVPGTENALYPFFSPDGEWVGYWRSGRQQGELMKVSLAGGDPFALCDSPEGPHSWWAEDDTIFFTWRDTGGLWSVSANGGEPRLIAEPEATGDVYHRPQLLPGGDAVLVELQSGNGGSVGVVSLADGSYTPVLDEGLDPRYVSSGHLVFGRGDTIWAVGFDPDTMQTIGQQTPVQRGVRGRPGSTSNFEVGLDGTLAFVPGTVAGARIGTPTRLVWLDRQGNAEPLPVEQAPFSRPRLAPAGDEIAVARRSAEGSDIYIYEVADGAGRRLTLEGDEFWPVWTPDGEWVLFGADRGGSENIYRKRADGTTDAAEEVVVVDEGVAPASVSPDGSEVFFELDAAEHVDVLRAPIGAEGEPEPVLDSRFSEEDARLSPDGTLLAYASDRTGSGEIYVLDISTGRPIPVSIGGGDSPFWSTDGSELYFLDGQRRNFMVAAVAMTESGPELGTPEVLFQRDRNIGAPLEPAADGRFLAVERLINPDADTDDEQQATGPQINIVLNWIEELRRLAPTRR